MTNQKIIYHRANLSKLIFGLVLFFNFFGFLGGNYYYKTGLEHSIKTELSATKNISPRKVISFRRALQLQIGNISIINPTRIIKNVSLFYGTLSKTRYVHISKLFISYKQNLFTFQLLEKIPSNTDTDLNFG